MVAKAAQALPLLLVAEIPICRFGDTTFYSLRPLFSKWELGRAASYRLYCNKPSTGNNGTLSANGVQGGRGREKEGTNDEVNISSNGYPRPHEHAGPPDYTSDHGQLGETVKQTLKDAQSRFRCDSRH